MTEKSWYITTPIYYVNDVPHIGHAYTTIAADFLARWHRLHGRRVMFLTGTDEHGQKMAEAAARNGYEPQAWCDQIVPRWRELWERLQISNDDFIRTTEDRHHRAVERFMTHLHSTGEIYLASYEGLYCVRCEEYKTDAELVDGNCAIHGTPVETLTEDNYFFRLSKYNDALLEHYEKHPGFVRPARARNELLSLLKQGLRDIPISRPTVSWGIPVPWDDKHVIYVWIEALQNYITAPGYQSEPERFRTIWPADVHLVGKDIVRFHAVIWPAMLMAAGLPLPHSVFAHGWLLVGGEKISKSGRSITQISPHELADAYGVDAVRFHLLRAGTFGEDGNFSLEDLEARYNAELANDLGNLASRTVAMIGRYFDGVIPAAGPGGGPEAALAATVGGAGAESDALIGELRITEAIARVWEIVRHANRYLVEREPWKLARDEANHELVGTVLHAAADALRASAALLSPAIPAKAAELWAQLGLDGMPRLEDAELAGRALKPAGALFPRLEPA